MEFTPADRATSEMEERIHRMSDADLNELDRLKAAMDEVMSRNE